jgi:hypothetical protein
VAAVAIVFLLFWSIESGLTALYWLFSIPFMNFWGAFDFYISDISYALEAFVTSLSRQLTNGVVLIFLLNSIVCLIGAWFLSRWVFGLGPVRSLSTYRVRVKRGTHE